MGRGYEKIISGTLSDDESDEEPAPKARAYERGGDSAEGPTSKAKAKSADDIGWGDVPACDSDHFSGCDEEPMPNPDKDPWQSALGQAARSCTGHGGRSVWGQNHDYDNFNAMIKGKKGKGKAKKGGGQSNGKGKSRGKYDDNDDYYKTDKDRICALEQKVSEQQKLIDVLIATQQELIGKLNGVVARTSRMQCELDWWREHGKWQ